MRNTSFLETQTILTALEFALKKGAFGTNSPQRKAAQTLIRSMQSNKSVSGRHQQLMDLLTSGATLEQMMKTTGASRRTVFRYLNHLEEAGKDIELAEGTYRLK